MAPKKQQKRTTTVPPPSRSQGVERAPVVLIVGSAPQTPANVQLRYLGKRSGGRELAEIVGAASFVDYLVAAILAAQKADEVATTTKKLVGEKTTALYFTQEQEGQPFDSVLWRGEKNPLGIEVAFTVQPKNIDPKTIEESHVALGPLFDAFVEAKTSIVLEGEIARWLCAGALGATPAPANGKTSCVTVEGPLADELIAAHPELEGREDVKIKREWALRSDFDVERRRRYGEMDDIQREACRKLRRAGFAQPRVGVVRE